MSRTKAARKASKKRFAATKRIISAKDTRISDASIAIKKKDKSKKSKEDAIKYAQPYNSALFFDYNTQLGPPYRILLDTNFINFSIKSKLDIMQSLMDCLYAKCIPYVTDCVIAELEKLGVKHRIALRIVNDPRFQRIRCDHKGTYADDCLVKRVTDFKCYIVATNDKDLKNRIRKIPGVPIMYVAQHKYAIERMPESLSGIRK